MDELGQHVFSYHTDHFGAIYHAVTMDVLYFKPSVHQVTREPLVDEFISRNQTLSDRAVKLARALDPSWETLYLFLNDTCNMRCRYCRYMSQMPFDKKMEEMDYGRGKRLIDAFAVQSNGTKRKTFVFFGTEVFLSFDLMRSLMEYIRAVSPSSEVVVFTNGTLVNRKRANALSDLDAKCIVSLDGARDVHDSERVFRGGKPTFDRVLRGYHTLKDAGLTVGVSLTVGGHNVDQLDEIIEHFHRELAPINVGFNPLEVTNRYPPEVFLDLYIAEGMKAYRKARELGISIPQIMHRIRPFVERTIRVRDCPSCGGAVRAFQNGDFGPCSHFVIDGIDRVRFADIESFDFSSNEVIVRWNNRMPLRFECHKHCFAIGICGGGCVRNAYLIHGRIDAPDDRICAHSRYAVEWLLQDLFDIVRRRGAFLRDGYYVPTRRDRKEIYGNIKETACLPLQDYSTFGELKL